MIRAVPQRSSSDLDRAIADFCNKICQKQTYAPQQNQTYSMTSSAIATSVGGGWRPSTFAVLRFIASSNLSGDCKGRSAHGWLLTLPCGFTGRISGSMQCKKWP